jgi:hypothetical protein
MSKFLSEEAACPRAAAWAMQQGDAASRATSVSNVVLNASQPSKVMLTLNSVAKQSQSSVDVVLVGENVDTIGLSRAIRRDTELHIELKSCPEAVMSSNLLQAAMAIAEGEYLLFLDAGETLISDQLTTQSSAMQEHGWLASRTLLCATVEEGNGAGSGVVEAIPCTEIGPNPIVMVHRSVVSHGDGQRLDAMRRVEAGATNQSLENLADTILRRAIGDCGATGCTIKEGFLELENRV